MRNALSACANRGPLVLAALWWGGMSGLSFVAVPLLFAFFGNPAVAGPLAAQYFQFQAWATVVVALLLLLWGRAQRRSWPGVNRLLPWLVLAALAALVQEYGVSYQILTARSTGGNVRLWHGVGTALILVQWFSALRVLWWLSRPPAPPTPGC